MTQAFVYRWTHLPTGKWYIGSRSALGCHPNDGYICSSKIVKPLIQINPKEWSREIISIGTPEEMRKLETDLLKFHNARKNPDSFNQTNGNGHFFGGRPSGVKNRHYIDFNSMSLEEIVNGFFEAQKSKDKEKIFLYHKFILGKVIAK